MDQCTDTRATAEERGEAVEAAVEGLGAELEALKEEIIEHLASYSEEARVETPCSCGWRDSPDHDSLLRMEEYGFAGAVEVISTASTYLADSASKNVGPIDLPDFVAIHNWQDPFRVMLLAWSARDLVQDQIALRRATSALTTVEEVAARTRRLDALHHAASEVCPAAVGGHCIHETEVLR